MKSGIGITSNDGGIIENVHYKNIKIKNAAVPIFIEITDRLRSGEPDVKTEKIRNVTMQNIECSEVVAGKHHGPANAATISGRPESFIESILLDNVKITYKGGEKREEADLVPKYPKDYSPNAMGKRPASGFFVRNAKDITFRNMQIAYEGENVKPVMVFWDVAGVTLDHVQLPKPAGGMETVRFERVSDVKVIDSPGIDAPPAQQASK